MAENNKHDNDKNENIEALKSAAANKAVKTAATFGANAGNVAMSLGKGIVNGLKTAGTSIAHGFGFVTGKVAAVGSAVGLSPIAANLTLVILTTMLGSTVVSTVQENQYYEDLKYNTVWSDEDPCAGFVMEQEEGDIPDNDAAAKMRAVKQIWSFAHWYAQKNKSPMSWQEVDMRVAGMVGCFVHESGISPAAIEGTYDQAKLQKLIKDLQTGSGSGAIKVDGKTYSTLGGWDLAAFSDYSEPIASKNAKSFYQFSTSETMTMGTTSKHIGKLQGDGGCYCGLGLGQVTGPRAVALLRYSDMAGVPWYDITCQLAFWVTGDDPYYTSGAFIPYLTKTSSHISGTYNCKNDFGSVKECCLCWAKNYESANSNESNCKTRIQSAEEWYSIIKMWSQSQVDASTIASVCDILAKTTGNADLTASMELMDDCGEITGIGNMTIADYASLCSYDSFKSEIYSGKNLGHYDNGTPLYRYVVKQCNAGYYYGDTSGYSFQDCAKGACAVLHWAGADDDILPGSSNTLSYMKKHPDKWQVICSPGNYHWDKIQPGDVFNYTGHIFIYIGEEAWYRFHVAPNDEAKVTITYDSADKEHGGSTVTVPGIKNVATGSSYTPDGSSSHSKSMTGQNFYAPYLEGQHYYVFRNIKPEENSKYANVVDLNRLVQGCRTDGHISTTPVSGSTNGQCTKMPDLTVTIHGEAIVIKDRYHFSWQSVRSNIHGSDNYITGCPDYHPQYATNYNIYPQDKTKAST